jgi:hypothetical protein
MIVGAAGAFVLAALVFRGLCLLTMPDPFDEDTDLRAILETLDRAARDTLRRVLIGDQADRDAISSRLMRCRDQNGDDRADIVDFLTMWSDTRRKPVRLLAEFVCRDRWLTPAMRRGPAGLGRVARRLATSVRWVHPLLPTPAATCS